MKRTHQKPRNTGKTAAKRRLTEQEAAALPPRGQYLWRMDRFRLLYLELVIGGGILLALSLAVAMLVNAAAGVVLALITAALYSFFTASEANKLLGVTYEIREGTLSLTDFDAKGQTELVLPRRLFWRDTEVLAAPKAPRPGNASLERLYLPKTLTRVEAGAFSHCPALRELLYEGSASEWEALTCEADLSALTLTFDVAYPVREDPEALPAEAKALPAEAEALPAEAEALPTEAESETAEKENGEAEDA